MSMKNKVADHSLTWALIFETAQKAASQCEAEYAAAASAPSPSGDLKRALEKQKILTEFYRHSTCVPEV